jgi:hypothetical protein
MFRPKKGDTVEFKDTVEKKNLKEIGIHTDLTPHKFTIVNLITNNWVSIKNANVERGKIFSVLKNMLNKIGK